MPIINFFTKKITINIGLLSVLISGILFRVYNIGYDDLWYDEIISFWVANPEHTLKQSYNIHQQIEIAPYTFNLILKFYYEIFGYNVDFARYLPCLFSVGTIILVYKVSKEINPANTSLLATFLTSFNIFLIGYAQEQRVYSLLIFFSLASILYFFRSEKVKPNFFELFLFFLTTLILIFLHLFSIFILFSYLLYLFLKYKKYKEKFLKVHFILLGLIMVSIIFYTPYILNFSENLTSNLDVNYSWNNNPTLKFLTNFYFSNYFGSRLMGLIFLLIFLILLYQNKKIFLELKKSILLLIIIISSYSIPILFGFIFKPILLARYISYVPILVIILISSFLHNSKNKKFLKITMSILIISTIGNMFTEQTFKQFIFKRVPTKPQYLEAIKYISTSDQNYYTLKIENMKNNDATIKSINNYIDHLSKKYNFKINFLRLDIATSRSLWVFCPMDINSKNCPLPDKIKGHKIIKEKDFNNINLKLIEM